MDVAGGAAGGHAAENVRETACAPPRWARRRSLGVLAIFTTAMLVAFLAPRLGFRADPRRPNPPRAARGA